MITEENTNPEDFETPEGSPEETSKEEKLKEETLKEETLKEEVKDEKVIIEDKPPFWKKHFLKLLLLLLLVVSMAWGYFGKQRIISEHEKEVSQLNEVHQSEIRELKAEHVKNLSSTLALAIRSEMIADNMHQIDQYFIQTVKMFDVVRILLVNHTTGEVILSTNKKDEGSIFEGEDFIKATKALKKTYNNHTYAATPIMGLNTQLAVLIIQVD